MVEKFLEFKKYDFSPIKSFYLKDTLDPEIWNNFILEEKIRENLTTISKDFFKATEIKAKIYDIILCGSLCNYNWNETYSDYDIHIIIDFLEINEDFDLVEKLCDYAKKQWNLMNDIVIGKYEVEVSIQDKNDLEEAMGSDRMGGIFSLLNNKWIKKPKREDFVPDEKLIKRKSKSIMQKIDALSEDVDKSPYKEFKSKIDRVWKKIKKIRIASLAEDGEFGIGNLIFKLLRRNGYIGKIMNLKKYSYKKQFESLSENNILELCYLLDNLQKDVDNYSEFGSLTYDVDEKGKEVRVSYSEYGYSDSFKEELVIHYTTSPILVEVGKDSTSGFGNSSNSETRTFNSFNELANDIKSEFSI